MITFPYPRSFTIGCSRFFLKPATTAFLLGVISIGLSVAAIAQHTGAGPTLDVSAEMTSHGTEDITTHISGMLGFIYADVGATDTQKAKLASIVQQARTDLSPLEQELQNSHKRLFDLLTQAQIDRDAVESERVAHVRIADQSSKRATQFFIDVAEALTPEQRKALTEHMADHSS